MRPKREKKKKCVYIQEKEKQKGIYREIDKGFHQRLFLI